jgi:neutral ceramidase
MKSGFAQRTITPPVGCHIVGPVAAATGTHDDLFARVVVLDDGATKVAILALDLIGIGWELADELRALVCDAAGTDFSALQFSHTHNSPFPPTWMTSVYDRDRELLDPWRDMLRAELPAMAAEAAAAVAPVTLRAGRAPVAVGTNRRVMSDEGVVMHPNPDGPIVPWVDTLSFHDESGALRGVLFEHAAHPVIVHMASTLFSADFPGYACTHLASALGDDVATLFVQGCGADINGDPLAAGFEAADAAGKKLADAVVAAIESATPISADTLTVTSRVIDLPCREAPPIEEVQAKLVETQAEIAAEPSEWADDRIVALTDLIHMIETDHKPTMRVDLAMLSLGREWGMMCFSGEMFCEYQLWFDQASPFEHTMVGAYTNNFGGYIATDAELSLETLGGYEAACWPTGSCALIVPTRLALQIGIEQIIKQAVTDMWA